MAYNTLNWGLGKEKKTKKEKKAIHNTQELLQTIKHGAKVSKGNSRVQR